MSTSNLPRRAPRRRVNLTISADVMEAARALGLNASEAAEAGIAKAVAAAKAAAWLDAHEAAISAHNTRITRDGPLLTPAWAEGDDMAEGGE